MSLDVNTRKLAAIFGMIKRNNITLFKLGELEIHREIVDNDIENSVAYVREPTGTTDKEIQEAIDELQDIEDDNLMISDPEEYERRLREGV